jgi:hypothetical protein
MTFFTLSYLYLRILIRILEAQKTYGSGFRTLLRTVLWIQIQIRKDPKLFAGSGSVPVTRGYGSGSGIGFETGLKGTVQRKLTGVLSGINRKHMICHCSDGYSSFNL